MTPPQEDVGVGIAGVVAIDRNPVEPGTEVGFHLLHQIAGGLAQVGQFNTLRGYDEAELVAAVTAPVEEGATVRPIPSAAWPFSPALVTPSRWR